MKNKFALAIAARYVIAILLGLGNLWLFYLIFTPATVYSVYWIVSLFDSVRLVGGNVLAFSGFSAEIIAACVGGAAYYLLVLLNLTTPMEIKKRILNICFLVTTFFVVNVVRVVAFIFLAARGTSYFDAIHVFSWYVGSTLLVAAIWFVGVKVFRIRGISVYSDFREVVREIKLRK